VQRNVEIKHIEHVENDLRQTGANPVETGINLRSWKDSRLGKLLAYDNHNTELNASEPEDSREKDLQNISQHS